MSFLDTPEWKRLRDATDAGNMDEWITAWRGVGGKAYVTRHEPPQPPRVWSATASDGPFFVGTGEAHSASGEGR